MALVPVPRSQLIAAQDRTSRDRPARSNAAFVAPVDAEHRSAGPSSGTTIDGSPAIAPTSPADAAARIESAMPVATRRLLERLWAAGYPAYAVGGALRDVLLGRPAEDWDLASAALPDDVQKLFPGSKYENRFGTVAVADEDGAIHEITTFRDEHDYADFRRPHRVEFGRSIEADVARRDFTMNALAWGSESGSPLEIRLVDPFGGLSDIAERRLRTVGEPERRFGEDALRMLRAVRFAATLGVRLDDTTVAGIAASAPLAAHLSGERVGAELSRILAAVDPSAALRPAAETGLLRAIVPELEAQRGVRQNKIPGEDLWAHTVRTVDAVAANRPLVRLAALFHDVGKPSTAADGHFYGHDVVGARIATDVLRRLKRPGAEIEAVASLVREHMFGYQSAWGDGAIRRFIAKVGPDRVDDLLALRQADNVGSGLPPDAGRLDELRARIDEIRSAPLVLDRRALAVDGRDLIADGGFTPGPVLGRVLDRLLERVIADPDLNDRAMLLRMARQMRPNAERAEAERRAARTSDGQ